MCRPLVCLLLLVQATLLLHLGNSFIHLLRLLFGSECSLLSGGSSIVAVLAPVSEVARTCHVILWETKYFQGLDEEFLLREGIADEVVVVGGVLVWQEVGGWLSQSVLAESFIEKLFNMSAVKCFQEIFLTLNLLFDGFSQCLFH